MRHALLLFMLLVSAANINGQALPDTVSYESIKIKPGDLVLDFSAQDENLKIKAIMKIDTNYYMSPRVASRSKSIDTDIIIKMIEIDSLIIKAMDKGTWNRLKHFI